MAPASAGASGAPAQAVSAGGRGRFFGGSVARSGGSGRFFGGSVAGSSVSSRLVGGGAKVAASRLRSSGAAMRATCAASRGPLRPQCWTAFAATPLATVLCCDAVALDMPGARQEP